MVKPRSFYSLLHPRPVVLLTTKCLNDRVNIAPFSWVTPVSEEPPTIAIAIDRENYTYQCLEHCNEAVANIPAAEHYDLVYKLGRVSGRSVDKVKEFNLRLCPSRTVTVPRWCEAIGWLELKLLNRVPVGEVDLCIFQVVDYDVKEGSATEWGWDLAKVSPLLHNVGKSFAYVGRRLFAK